MSARLLICIPCHNRKRVAELCLPTTRDAMHADDKLILWNDGSFEYDTMWLTQFLSKPTDDLWQSAHGQPEGIQAQRRMHLRSFLAAHDFSHLYFSDHDVIVDPTYRDEALRLQSKYDLPICLYNTAAHERIPGNTIEDDPASEIIVRRFAPGVSYLLTRAHVERIAPHIDRLEHFDWQIPEILGGRFGISRVGYVDHLGWGGVRHPVSEGPDGGDRVKQPTPWLVAKRAEIVAKLSI